MEPDEIIREIRRIRESYAEQFDFDIEAICRDLKEQERTSGREFVRFAPRPAKQVKKKAS